MVPGRSALSLGLSARNLPAPNRSGDGSALIQGIYKAVLFGTTALQGFENMPSTNSNPAEVHPLDPEPTRSSRKGNEGCTLCARVEPMTATGKCGPS
jgi:hypothetical protein